MPNLPDQRSAAEHGEGFPFAPGVYVMAAPAYPQWGIKLGHTWRSSVTARARQVAGALPVDVVSLAFAPVGSAHHAQRCEEWLHSTFAPLRWRGEWFRMRLADQSWDAWLDHLVRFFWLLTVAEAEPAEIAANLTPEQMRELLRKLEAAEEIADSISPFDPLSTVVRI